MTARKQTTQTNKQANHANKQRGGLHRPFGSSVRRASRGRVAYFRAYFRLSSLEAAGAVEVGTATVGAASLALSVFEGIDTR